MLMPAMAARMWALRFSGSRQELFNMWPFTFQKTAYCMLKGHLLEAKRWPFVNR